MTLYFITLKEEDGLKGTSMLKTCPNMPSIYLLAVQGKAMYFHVQLKQVVRR